MAEILNIFNHYVVLNKEFIISVPKTSSTHNSYRKLRSDVEGYVEKIYNPVLKNAKLIVCGDGDAQLLSAYIQVIIHMKNSADEYPAYILGEMFIC